MRKGLAPLQNEVLPLSFPNRSLAGQEGREHGEVDGCESEVHTDGIFKLIHGISHPLPSILIGQVCHNRVPQLVWLWHHTYFPSQFCRPRGLKVKVFEIRVGLFFLSLAVSGHLLPVFHLPICVLIYLLIRTQSHWVRTHPTDLIFNFIASLKALSMGSHILRHWV